MRNDTGGRDLVRGALPRLDPLDKSVAGLLEAHPQLAEGMAASRVLAATHFGDRLLGLIRDPSFDLTTLLGPGVPGQLTGVLVQPDGRPAAQVQVTVAEPFPGGPGPGTCVTGVDGAFTVSVPAQVRTGPATGELTLAVTGATRTAKVPVELATLTATGAAGVLTLPDAVDPLPVSVVAQLGQIVAQLDLPTPGTTGAADAASAPKVTLGADVCQQIFRSDLSMDRFPYAVLVRLVEPRPSVGSLGLRLHFRGRELDISAAYLEAMAGTDHAYTFAERLPVDQPISVDAFRSAAAGIDQFGSGSFASTVPIAGSLGLGYMVHLAQRWTPKGLALGDLVYSLPLAPGEQQRVAVVDRRATTAVFESERLDVQEQQAFRERDDSSTRATFASGMSESAAGGSHFSTEAHSSSWGVAGGIGFALGPVVIGGGAAGGGGSSSSSGDANNWMSGVRNYTSDAVQSSHAAVERSASARRSAQRTSMRLAAAAERTEVVTKTVTNHNKTRALTMQYWEVLRMFDVRSTVDGVTLVCFVPLDPIRFLPSNEPVALTDAAVDRAGVLHRYGRLLSHVDTLRRVVDPPYRKGLALLEEFAADPRATVQSPADAAADVVTVFVDGTFLPNEDVWVTLLASGGRRIGPYPMPTGAPIDPIPTRQSDPANALASEAELLGYLRERRAGQSTVIERGIVLPEWLPRTDVVGVELSRQFRPLHYRFPGAATVEATTLSNLFGAATAAAMIDKLGEGAPSRDVTFTAEQLEQEVGGPRLRRVKAALVDPSESIGTVVLPDRLYLNDYLGDLVLSTAPEPFAARQLPPELRYSALLEIERVLQHVVPRTVTYSKAVWMSLTAEERVMMLEGYTVGVAGGVEDGTENIPLLACVANQLLGFYGNCMVLPFMIPAELVARRKAVDGVAFTTATVQEALTRYHTTGFSPPVSTIALPTHGVLGEAVLGHCPSAERIDLTRFWNWQDSPADSAPVIADTPVPSSSLTAGLQAPNTLTGLSPIITNFSNAGPTADSSLAQALIRAGAEAKGFDINALTGSTALAGLLKDTLTTAESARKDALAGAQSMANKAMDKAAELAKAKLEQGKAKPKDDGTPGGGAGTGGAAGGSGTGGAAGGGGAPTVTAVVPGHGKPGTAVAVTGTGFTGATAVKVGTAGLVDLTVVDATRIEGKVPALAPGAVDVVVTTPAGGSAATPKSRFTVDA
ncbi:IPT/TIG domain-containing protein [Kitasatospora sp. NPDC049285]|uniref:IPT/TIG domain-containing protein n=1 Tax=Kitasatospora sp. NPDC049285 TaxID=3157096 RepID=UPI003448F90C